MSVQNHTLYAPAVGLTPVLGAKNTVEAKATRRRGFRTPAGGQFPGTPPLISRFVTVGRRSHSEIAISEFSTPRTRAGIRFVGLSRPVRLGTRGVNNPERRLAGDACQWLPSARKMTPVTRQPVNPPASVKPRVREFWAQVWGTGALASGVPATTGRHRRDEESLAGGENDANPCRKAG